MDDMKVQVLDTAFDEVEVNKNIQEAVKRETATLIDYIGTKGQTALLVFPHETFSSFENFLIMVSDIEDMIKEDGLDSKIQLATFHPSYMFTDSANDKDVTNYTNRSPWPTLQLLRVDDVTKAIESFEAAAAARGEVHSEPATNRIWKRNKITFIKLGIHAAEAMLGDIMMEVRDD